MQDSQASGSSTRHPIVVPSRSDSLLRAMTEPVGGPLGKHTAPGVVNPGFFTVERVLILMAAVSAFIAVMGKAHCRTVGWTTPDQESTVCWSLIPNSFLDDKIGTLFPFFSQGSPFDQPVLAGWIAGITAWLTASSGNGALRQLAFFDINAALIAVLWIITVVIAARTAGRRPWDAAIVAASPLLILTAYVSWDFWAVALVSLALYLFARRHVLWAGGVLGVAALAAPYPVVILLVLLLLGIRAGRATQMMEMIAAAAISCLLLLAPVMVQNPPAFPDYLKGLLAAEPSESSIYGGWNIITAQLGFPSLSLGMTNALSAIFMAALILGVAYMALSSLTPPRVGQLIFVAVAGFVVFNKTVQPWDAMWLLPLVALAMPRWRPVLLWQAAIVTHFIALMLYRSKTLGDIGNQHAIDSPYFVMAAFLAGAASCAMIALVIRDIYSPRHDVVTHGIAADPQGGVFLEGPRDPAGALRDHEISTRSSV